MNKKSGISIEEVMYSEQKFRDLKPEVFSEQWVRDPKKTGVWAEQRNEEGASAEQRVGALKGTSTKPSVRGLK